MCDSKLEVVMILKNRLPEGELQKKIPAENGKDF